MTALRCPNGHVVADDDLFCGECGAPTVEPEPPGPPLDEPGLPGTPGRTTRAVTIGAIAAGVVAIIAIGFVLNRAGDGDSSAAVVKPESVTTLASAATTQDSTSDEAGVDTSTPPSTPPCSDGSSVCGHDEPAATWTLQPDGLGFVHFTELRQSAEPALRARFGNPTSDQPVNDCPSQQLSRIVAWKDLTLYFSDSDGADRLVGWDYGTDTGRAQPTIALAEGPTVGSTVRDLMNIFHGRFSIDGGSDGSPYGVTFTIQYDHGFIRGALTGTDDDATVTALSAGASCGE